MDGRNDDALNYGVRFLPADPDDEGTKPCVEIGGVQVYVYATDGRLVISAHFDTAEPPLLGGDGTVPVSVWMGGEEVFRA